MIHLLHLPHCCVDVNYCARVDCDAWRLIIPSSMGADVYAYALLLVAILLYVIACFIVWYANMSQHIWIAYKLAKYRLSAAVLQLRRGMSREHSSRI